MTSIKVHVLRAFSTLWQLLSISYLFHIMLTLNNTYEYMYNKCLYVYIYNMALYNCIWLYWFITIIFWGVYLSQTTLVILIHILSVVNGYKNVYAYISYNE